MKTRLLALAAALMCSLTTAHADTRSFSTVTTEGPTFWDAAFELPKFNPLLGVLNSATLSMTAGFSGNGGLENKQRLLSGNFDVQLMGVMSLDVPFLEETIGYQVPLIAEAVTLAKYDGQIDRAGTSGQSWAFDVQQTVERSYAGRWLEGFTGTDTFQAFLMADAFARIGGPTNQSSRFNTVASGLVTVTYDYTPAVALSAPVPEPGSLALMLSGLGAVGFLLSRRRLG